MIELALSQPQKRLSSTRWDRGEREAAGSGTMGLTPAHVQASLETLHARVQMSRDMVMATAVPSFRVDTHVARRRVTQPDVRADELAIDVLRISGLAATESVRQFTRAFRSPLPSDCLVRLAGTVECGCMCDGN